MQRPRLEQLRERLQEMLGVTKSELIVTLFILLFSASSFVWQVVKHPKDPFDRTLRAEIRRRLDSAASARDSIAGGILTDRPRNDGLIPRVKGKKVAPARKIDINSAPADSLCLIPGIGPTVAERIIARRTKRRFARVQDLRTVRGIGPKTYRKIAPHCTVRRSPSRTHP